MDDRAMVIHIAFSVSLLLTLAACGLTPAAVPTATATLAPAASPAIRLASTPSVPSLTPTQSTSARLNEPFALKLGQWATLADANNARVFFTSLIEDTRCALDVNCFQAGSVRVGVTVESSGKLALFDLSSKPSDYRRVGAFDGILVEFLDIAPARTSASIPISSNDYQVTLRVSKGSLKVSLVRINEPFALKIGQTVPIADTNTQVTLEAVQGDSRCPTRVSCVWNGAVDVVIALQRGDKTERLTLSTNRDGTFTRSSLFDSAGVYLNAVTPYPQNEFANTEIASSEYEVTLVFVNYVPASTPIAR